MSATVARLLTEYHFALSGIDLPGVNENLLLDYVIASNGVFARGRRPGLEVCMPVSFTLQPLRGLKHVSSYAQWGYPKVPVELLDRMVAVSRAVCNIAPREALFHLRFDRECLSTECTQHVACGAGWHVEWPYQRAGSDFVEPVLTGIGTSTERAVIELHSHHEMRAEFSPRDNEDESQGFRVYAVIGKLFSKPEISTRIGLFGHFWQYSAAEFFDLPGDLRDCVIAG